MGQPGTSDRTGRLSAIGYFDDGELRAGTGRYLTEIICALDRTRFHPVFFAPIPRAWHEDLLRLDVEMVYGTDTARPAPGRTAQTGTNPADRRRRPRLPASAAWTLGLLRDTARLSRLFRKRPVDLLHSNNTGAEPAPIAARMARVPRVIGTLHVLPSYDLQGARNGARYRLLEKASMRAMDHIIACCDAARHEWDRRCGLRADRVTVIHNGIRVDRVARSHSMAQARSLLELPADAFITASIGNLHRYKGHEFLVRALPALVARHPGILAVIAGTGPAERDLNKLVDELGLGDNVRLLGFCSEVGTLLDAADIYVHPSLVEAFPIAILEAGAAGLAVVATAVGGVPEAIEDGVTGLLAPAGDPAALTRGIGSLVDCERRRMNLGKAARLRVNTLFTTQQMLEKTTELYERMLS